MKYKELVFIIKILTPLSIPGDFANAPLSINWIHSCLTGGRLLATCALTICIFNFQSSYITN